MARFSHTFSLSLINPNMMFIGWRVLVHSIRAMANRSQLHEVADGLVYLHSNFVVHGDVKDVSVLLQPVSAH
jgi:serine/threonine protein kinase